MKRLFVLSAILFSTHLFSQNAVIAPLGVKNKVANTFTLTKRSVLDTLKLPFFDDFTSSFPYPNQSIWVDSFVNINNTFAISPPSYGVATFDNLNAKGIPYFPINANTHSESDYLTSSPINLKDYKSGLNTINYLISDSIYLSFFYQAKGLGDLLDNSDSLVLKFKDNTGVWRTEWKMKGGKMNDFKQILIGIKNTKYLYKGFQFRFINYTKNTGNMNQWHLDYVRMKASRNMHDTLIQDVAINAVPIGPLRWFESMPYKHFLADVAANSLGSHWLQFRNNLSTTAVNTNYACRVFNQYNNIIQDYPVSTVALNVPSLRDTVFKFTPFRMDTLSGNNPSIRLKYSVSPQSNDILPDNYNSIGNNNEFTKTVSFGNTYNYDDGSAEGGFGLDYASLPDGPGYAAIKYQNSLADTLRGIQLFYNRAVQDVEFKSYSLIVWKTISEPPAVNMSNDVILRKKDIRVEYDSFSNFITIRFDTAVFLSKGNYYIGWQQNNRYLLNIGYDNNYKYDKQGGRNPNLFFNLRGFWEKVSPSISGAVMMRPIFGAPIVFPSSIEKNTITPLFTLYPNPSNGNNNVQILGDTEVKSLHVFDAMGKLCLTNSSSNSFDAGSLSNGIYIVRITGVNKQIINLKYIKNE